MKINNVDIGNFKAKLLDRNIQSSNFNIQSEWLDNSLTPIINDKINYKYKTLTFTLDFICINANELEIMKSNLLNNLINSTIKFDDIDCYYKGFISGQPSSKYIMRGNETLEITMLVIAEKAEIVESINKVTSKTIKVQGNINTPCVVEITPSIDIIDITLEGVSEDLIVIRNLKANKTVILDGERQTVSVDGINKFADTDMWEFPRLSPGSNVFKFSRDNCDIKIRYKPRCV
ncbi:phage distal tail protein [Clostridium gasigenes]|uniref:phage distal tail protein n=1 Tax=Clostridium gasigenes TaxID=94869 RepID=UPI001C0E8CA8|nr:phage tail domain-containing protein [Clostridium gasigenes]MBU3109337.1 phage tail family protein [Clostridium gasigenes]